MPASSRSNACPAPCPPMFSSPVPLSPELWQRLRQLDRVGKCEIVLCRTEAKADGKIEARRDGDADPVVAARVWVVTIRKYMPPYRFDDVQHIRATLAEALRLAVEEAEARGWARVDQQ